MEDITIIDKYISDCKNGTLNNVERETMQVVGLFEEKSEYALRYALPIFEVTQKELMKRKSYPITNECKAISYLFDISVRMLKMKMAIDKTEVSSLNAPILKVLFEEDDEEKLQRKIDRYLVVLACKR